MDMMINAVTPDAAVMPSGDSGNITQASSDGAFGKILNDQMGQQSSDAKQDGATAQADSTSKPEGDQKTQDADINAAAAVIIAQFMQSNTPDTSGATNGQMAAVVQQVTDTASQAVGSQPIVVPQVTDGQQADSARTTIPVATDGGPYVPQQTAQTASTASDSATVIPVVSESTAAAVDVPVDAVPTKATSEKMTAQIGDQAATDGTKPNAGQGADTTLDPVVRTAIRDALGQKVTAHASQERVDSNQPQANQSSQAAGSQVNQGQAAANSQQVQFASAAVSQDSPVAKAVQANSGDNNRVRIEGLVTTDASVADVKVNKTDSSSGNTNTGSNSGFGFAGNGQVQMNTSDTVQAAATQTGTEAYSDVHQRVIDQVVREVKLRRFDQGGEIVMRLDPPELGTMHVRITQEAGIMTGHISASSDQVKGVLQSHLSTLVDALSEAGVKMDSVSVSTGMPSGTFSHDGARGNAQNNSNGSRRGYSSSGKSARTGALTGTAGTFSGNSNVGHSWLA